MSKKERPRAKAERLSGETMVDLHFRMPRLMLEEWEHAAKTWNRGDLVEYLWLATRHYETTREVRSEVLKHMMGEQR